MTLAGFVWWPASGGLTAARVAARARDGAP